MTRVCPSHLRRVPATTPVIETPKILGRGWNHSAIRSKQNTTFLIARSDRIAWCDKPTRRTPIIPSLRFVACAALWARLRGIGFTLPFEGDPLGRQFVGEILNLLAVRPVTDFLLALPI
jgi:hypothetical protein